MVISLKLWPKPPPPPWFVMFSKVTLTPTLADVREPVEALQLAFRWPVSRHKCVVSAKAASRKTAATATPARAWSNLVAKRTAWFATGGVAWKTPVSSSRWSRNSSQPQPRLLLRSKGGRTKMKRLKSSGLTPFPWWIRKTQNQTWSIIQRLVQSDVHLNCFYQVQFNSKWLQVKIKVVKQGCEQSKVVNVGDCVLVRPDDVRTPLFIFKIVALFQDNSIQTDEKNPSQNKLAHVQKFCRGSDTVLGEWWMKCPSYWLPSL